MILSKILIKFVDSSISLHQLAKLNIFVKVEPLEITVTDIWCLFIRRWKYGIYFAKSQQVDIIKWHPLSSNTLWLAILDMIEKVISNIQAQDLSWYSRVTSKILTMSVVSTCFMLFIRVPTYQGPILELVYRYDNMGYSLVLKTNGEYIDILGENVLLLLQKYKIDIDYKRHSKFDSQGHLATSTTRTFTFSKQKVSRFEVLSVHWSILNHDISCSHVWVKQSNLSKD